MRKLPLPFNFSIELRTVSENKLVHQKMLNNFDATLDCRNSWKSDNNNVTKC